MLLHNSNAPDINNSTSHFLVPILSTPSLNKLADVSELAIELNLISLNEAALLTHFPRLVYMLPLTVLRRWAVNAFSLVASYLKEQLLSDCFIQKSL